MKSFFRWVGILIGCVIIAAVIGVAIGKKEEFERQQAVPRVTAQKPTPPVSKPIDPAEAEREMWRRAEQRGMEQKQQREAKEKRALSAQQEAACQRIGPFARAIAELRQQGASLETAEAGAGMAISRYAGQDAAAMAKSIVRAIYANKLPPEKAEEVIVESCKVMVFMHETQTDKNR